jgi:hypothetical protein
MFFPMVKGWADLQTFVPDRMLSRLSPFGLVKAKIRHQENRLKQKLFYQKYTFKIHHDGCAINLSQT